MAQKLKADKTDWVKITSKIPPELAKDIAKIAAENERPLCNEVVFRLKRLAKLEGTPFN